ESCYSLLHDVVHHVGARSADDIAVVDARDDAAGAVSVSLESRGEADERFSVAGGVCAADELQLSAGAADLADAGGFGACLSGEIDLRSVADRNDAIVLHDVIWQIRVIDGTRETRCVAI